MDNHGLKLNPTRRQVVHENSEGVYLWRVPDRDNPDHKQYLSDGEGHYLMIDATYNDESAKRKMAREAAAVGQDDGWPVFFPGHRAVDDDQYEEQRMRFELGLEPDPNAAILRGK